MAATKPTAASRLAALDVLRAVAVLLVLGRHFRNIEYGMPPALAAVLRPWHSFGWIGVDLFFVLSGFLVSGLQLPFLRLRDRVLPSRARSAA